MEQTDHTEEPGEATEMLITFEAENFLRETGKWSNFLGLAGFVFSILTIISAFSTSSINAVVGSMQQTYGSGLDAKALGSGLSFLYFMLGVLIFIPSLHLFQFGASLKNGFNYGDQASINLAFQKLKSYFRFWGVLVISIIVFYVVVVIAAIAGGGVKV
ncbi:MAG: hypothetical protein EOP42_07705 [Sphingobacteriaceae bacterium]|nr:MAG: hypothetical protein EOP42_07705 [Sphingobacteriaceae bacterium]